jgi:hypothetical protein
LNETGSRPVHLDEFERKLAAALAQQPDARKTRFGSARSSDNVEVPSSPSLGEAVTPGSMGKEQPAKVEQPSSETRKTWTQSSSAEPKRVSPQGESAHDPAKATAAGGTADVHATQPSARLSNLTETSSADRAPKSPTQPSESSTTPIGISEKVTQATANVAPPAVTRALARSNGNGPRQEIGAAPRPVDSKARQTVDYEALLANIEPLLANDAEVAQVVNPDNLHARPVAEVIKRFSRDWKLMASAGALVSVAMVGAVALAHGMLAVPDTPPLRAHEPTVRETLTVDDTAEQALQNRALEPSSAAEDRLGANSEGVGATGGAPRAEDDTPAAGVTRATITPTGAPPGSAPEASDPKGLAPSLTPLAQPSALKRNPADVTATDTLSLTPPAQPSNLDPTPTDLTTAATSSQAPLTEPSANKTAPRVSPQPAPIPKSATFQTEGSPADDAPKPRTKPARNVHDVGMAKLSASRRDEPTKVVGKPSIEAAVTKNDATSAPVVTEKPNQPLPVGTPANPEKGAIASNVVQSPSPTSVDPGASGRQPLNRPTHAIGRGSVLAQYPIDATDPQPLLRAIGGMFGAGTLSPRTPSIRPPANAGD